MSYQVQCHCGAVQAEVDGDLPKKAVSCNCSHCSAKGLVLAAVNRDQLSIIEGEESLRTYKFNRHVIDHRFCERCGAQPFSEGTGQDGSAMAMINLRCAAQADLESIHKIPFDGASF
jgi:hypothetical protein